MTKEEIDKIFNNYELLVQYLECDINEFQQMDMGEVYLKLLDKIPNDLKQYFCEQCINFGLDNEVNFPYQLRSMAYKTICDKYTNMTDDEKTSVLDNIDSYSIKIRIIQSIKSNDKREELLADLRDNNKAIGIKNLDTDQEKIELLPFVENERSRAIIIGSFENDNLKVEYIDTFEFDSSKTIVICSLKNDEDKIKYIQTFDEMEFKANVIMSLNDDNNKQAQLSQLDKFEDSNSFIRIISSLNDDSKKIEYLQDLRIDDYFVAKTFINSIKDKDILNKTITLIDGDILQRLRKNNDFSIDFINANIEKFMINEGLTQELIEQKKDMLLKLQFENDEVNKTIIFDFLDESYIDFFTTEEQYHQIACYPEAQKKFIEINGDIKKKETFKHCLRQFIQDYGDDQWTKITEKILNNISTFDYEDLISSIENFEDIDFNRLNKILSTKNYFNITNVEQLNDYENIKEKVCDLIMNGASDEELEDYYEISQMSELDRKKIAVLEKLYGQDLKSAKRFVEVYGKDIDNISTENEQSKICVDYIRSLKAIINTTDETLLNDFYNIQARISEEYADTISMEREIQSAYMREYNDVLFDISKNEDKIIGEEDGIKVYNAGVDFNILMTSVGTYSRAIIENYKENWNRNTKSSKEFCTSFIRNDMLGTASITHVCYGFTKMSDDALVLSGPSNISSETERLNATSSGAEYYTPDMQINQRGLEHSQGKESMWLYNEMVVKRIQEGQRKQPDYILVFKENGEIPNWNEAKKAAKDFGGDIPIVIIDKDECGKSEISRTEQMIQEYKQTGDKSILDNIRTKVNNNLVANNYYRQHMENISIFLEETKDIIIEPTEIENKKQLVTESMFQECYNAAIKENEGLTTMQRETRKIREISSKLQQVQMERGE